MDIQERKCINCRAYDDQTNECALHNRREAIADAKTNWCMDGIWIRWDGNQWQQVYALDNCLDMKAPADASPIGRAIDTSMVAAQAVVIDAPVKG